MPSCVMRYCSNNSRNIGKSQGLTFHQFPWTSNETREIWIRFVRRNRSESTWLPSEYSRICSAHFQEDYKYITKTGRVYLKKSAVPFDDNDESSSEKDIIHVFCPKCNTKIPHTAEGIQQDQTRMLIAKVYHYFEQEYKELKTLYGNVDLSPLSKFRQRTTLATGVSDSMLQQILEEEKPREQDLARRPHKRRMDEDSSSDESTPEDSDGDAEADNGEQEPEQPHPAIETLVVKIEQPEITIDEPEIFVPAPLKTEPIDYDANNEQLQKDPISLDIKTEPQDDEMEIAIQTIQPGTSKYKERKRTKKSQETSTQNDFDGCKEESTSEEEMPTVTGTLENDTQKTAIEKEEVFACTCFMGCLSKRCLCKKKKLLCNPRCHYNVNCMNK